MKELEKAIPKNCPGVSSIVVKDLLQSMIEEDEMISVEKCGSTNVYWCFKSQVDRKMHDACVKVEKNVSGKKAAIEDVALKIRETLKEERATNINCGDKIYTRESELNKKKKLDELHKELEDEYTNLLAANWDQTKVDKEKSKLIQQNQKLDKITDNIELILSFISNKFDADVKPLRQEYEIPEEFNDFTQQINALP